MMLLEIMLWCKYSLLLQSSIKMDRPNLLNETFFLNNTWIPKDLDILFIK